jgi:hypothetical protein
MTTYCRDFLNDVLPESYEARLGEQLRIISCLGRRARSQLGALRATWFSIRGDENDSQKCQEAEIPDVPLRVT